MENIKIVTTKIPKAEIVLFFVLQMTIYSRQKNLNGKI